MILAHLPAGYLVGRALPRAPWVVAAAVLGGIFPDFDLLAFYLIDDRAIHHHRYWVHTPGFWLMLAPLILLVPKGWRAPAVAFLAAVFVHIFLDSIAGGIMWLWPLDNTLFTLVTVTDRFDPWIVNFLWHWTFLALELPIILTAVYLWWRG